MLHGFCSNWFYFSCLHSYGINMRYVSFLIPGYGQCLLHLSFEFNSCFNFITFIYLVCVFHGALMWRSENNFQESLLSFCHVDARDQNQVSRFGNKWTMSPARCPVLNLKVLMIQKFNLFRKIYGGTSHLSHIIAICCLRPYFRGGKTFISGLKADERKSTNTLIKNIRYLFGDLSHYGGK